MSEAPAKTFNELTPSERSLLRTGACAAIQCEDCPQFEFRAPMDGFRICECGHTQHSHAYGEGIRV